MKTIIKVLIFGFFIVLIGFQLGLVTAIFIFLYAFYIEIKLYNRLRKLDDSISTLIKFQEILNGLLVEIQVIKDQSKEETKKISKN